MLWKWTRSIVFYQWTIKSVTLLWFLFVGVASCDNDPNSPSPNPTPTSTPYDLEVELVWNEAVNMDLWIIEPTGKGSGHGDPGITAFNTGNNDCGFGDACVPSSCSDLPCNIPEQIVVYRGTALPDTTEPFHIYEIGISNWSSSDTAMILRVRTPTASQTFNCFVDGPRVSYVVNVSFPDGTITDAYGFVDAYCD